MTLRKKLFLVSLLYFAEGFPFGIIEQTLPIYFKIHGMSLVNIGLLSLISLPYALKFLWAPAVDFVGNRRQWILAAQLFMAASILVLLPLDPSDPNLLLWSCIAVLAIMSATQDIAIDAYTIELLKTSEMGIANGFRQAAYRGALVLSGGLFVTLGGRIGWQATYFIAASILIVCGIISMRLPRVEIQRPAFSASSLFALLKDLVALLKDLVAFLKDLVFSPGFLLVGYFVLLYELGGISMAPMFWQAAYYVAAVVILVLYEIISKRFLDVKVSHPTFLESPLMAPLRDFISRPGFVQVGLFVLLYKLGDLAMGPMVRPFWMDKGLTTDEIGLITGTLGVAASVAGGLVGGLFMVRYGIFYGLLFLGIWQSVSNLSYAWVAACPSCGNRAVYAASFVESFCAGLGTSAFLAFLMSVCKKEYSATQYAILSALFRIPGIICGSFSGFATTHFGYAQYFALTFLLSLPAFAFIFHARRWIPQNSNDEEHLEEALLK